MSKTIVGLVSALFMLVGCCDKARCIGIATDILVVTAQPMKVIPGSMPKDKESRIAIANQQQIMDFIPKGYQLFDKVYGDLNKDGYIDCVLIIKATREDGFVNDSDGHKVDRNRRGIIILFKHSNGYKLALKNESCFSSENEDGGSYDPPQLNVCIKDNKLYLHYNYGRYGFWEYCFRYQSSDFMLIGYEKSRNYGAKVFARLSINFLTGVKYVYKNIYGDDYDKETKLKRIVHKLARKPLMRLSKIRDLDEVSFAK